MELFVEDAEFTDVVNQRAIGKAAIRKQHQFAFDVVMKHATLSLQQPVIRELIPKLIMVTANWLNQGSQTPDGKPLPDRTGVIQLIFIRMKDFSWRLKLVHNADFALPLPKTRSNLERIA